MLFIAKVIVEKKYNIYIFKTSVQGGGGMTGKQRNKDDRNNLFTMGKHQSANISVRTIRKGINSHEIGDSYTQ